MTQIPVRTMALHNAVTERLRRLEEGKLKHEPRERQALKAVADHLKEAEALMPLIMVDLDDFERLGLSYDPLGE